MVWNLVFHKMTIILYSDKKMEKNVELCLQSLKNKDLNNVRFVYYTIGFESSIDFKNLIKHKIETDPSKHNMWYYKPELCLKTIDLYTDDHYIYTDADLIFSRRFNFDLMRHNESYPLATYGPFANTCIWNWDSINGYREFTEHNLMKYFGVPEKTMRYVWACFKSFNNQCKDFFEEEISFIKNKYLLKNPVFYFPFGDETTLNVCLWKRNATKNLGFSMLNTNSSDHVKFIEENDVLNYNFGKNLSALGEDWEYVHDSKNILFYHGFKDLNQMEESVKFINYEN